MIIENSPVGSSKSNGVVERATHSVQGMTSSKSFATEESGRWILM